MAELILGKLLVAAATGFIIGTERGWSARALDDREQLAGMRTFTLAGLAGGVCGVLDGGTVLLAILVGAIGVLLAGTRFITPPENRDLGLTTELALLVTPLLGAFATTHALEATAAAAIIAALLGFKQELHGILHRLGRLELLASLKLLIVAVVILPLLPDQNIGPTLLDPWASLNPRTIGWLVLLLVGVSWVGYFATRIVGPGRGILLTALLGGFTSSTAVTLAYARLSKQNPPGSAVFSAGIALACAMLAPRVAIIIGAIQPALLREIGAPLAVLGIVPLLYAAWIARHALAPAAFDGVQISNPFAIGAALAMAAAITVLSVLVRGAEALVGDAGTYVVAALSGILDVDAVSVAIASGPAAAAGSAARSAAAANGILLACGVNTVTKAIMALITGSPELGRRAASVLLLAAAGAGLVALAG